MERKSILQRFKAMSPEDIRAMWLSKREVRVYFSPEQFRTYQEGKPTVGSTERFESCDIFVDVPRERIESITHGGVIVNIKEAEKK